MEEFEQALMELIDEFREEVSVDERISVLELRKMALEEEGNE